MINLNNTRFDDLPLTGKDEILKRVSDYQIYQYYIEEELVLGRAMHSPLRKDDIPSFSFWRNATGKIVWRDFATGKYGDCFNFVQEKFILTFRQALIKITKDFNLPLYCESGIGITTTASPIPRHKVLKMPEASRIGVKIQSFTKTDAEYWSKYGISSEMLKQYNVFSCSLIFSGTRVIGRYKKDNPIYAYLFYKDGEYTWKIYKPLEADKRFKWMSNTNKSILQGWDQMPESGNLLIINKSMKDVMVAKTLGYEGLSMQSESQMIKPIVAEELKRRFSNIIILQDFDLAGVSNANKHYKAFGFIPVFLQSFGNRGNGLKDISDVREKLGYEEAKRILDNIVKNNLVYENTK
jgi:hypothetical protein